MLRYLLIMLLLAFQIFAKAAEPDLLWLPFDEQTDSVYDNRLKPAISADLYNVQWTQGAFGKALCFSGTNSFVEIDAIPALRSARSLTLSIWVMWTGASGRSYPNILSTKTWSPGGMLLFVNNDSCTVRFGTPDTKGKGWQETSALFLNKLPKNRWTHLCVTFDLPVITAYVNGVKTGSAKWDFPVQTDALRLGGWGSKVCHTGLMDDLRIYSTALSVADVKALAAAPERSGSKYTVHPSKPMPEIAAYENRYAAFSIDQRGRISRLYSKKTKRSLLSRSTTLVQVDFDTRRRVKACRAEMLDKSRVRFYFPEESGYVDLKIISQDSFFDIAVLECTLSDVKRLTFFEIASSLKTYKGRMANMLSDDLGGICLRGYDLPVEMSFRGDTLRLQTTKELGLTGWRAGLAAGPRADIPSMLQDMAVHAGVPRSVNGGPWSLGSKANRGSYIFANLSLASVDDWIELANRCGYATIHLHGWWERLGHYPIQKNYYPKGESDLKLAVQRIHAAGLTAGMHTLTACIHPQDSWVSPKPHPDLLAAKTYTLAQNISADASAIFVNEPPAAGHDIVFTYSGNGNALRIGDEIIKYTRISRSKPYGFFDCERGAFGTHPAAHHGGGTIDYLQQRYYAFYPKPDSALAEELAARLAHIFNSCDIDNFYFDGSEGMRSRYGIDFMRHCIMQKLGDKALIEASCHGAHNWWFHSRLGAWDHPVWGMKRFHDKHIKAASVYRKSELLATQLGWWAPRKSSARARGHFLDEMEYFACKNLAMNTASSIQGVNVSHAPLSSYIEKQMTILGWYEKLRMAGYFDDETLKRIAVPGEEFELRQHESGVWRFTPVEYQPRRISASEDQRGLYINHFQDQPLSLRIEALQRALPYDHKSGVPLLTAADCSDLNIRTASSSIKLGVAVESSSRFKDAVKLQASNETLSARGAWACASRSFAPDYLNISKSGAVGVWVKGDAKGALLNIQLETPREHMHALAEHYVKVDFLGWRYFELHFKERDTRLHSAFVWPYSAVSPLYRTSLSTKHISKINIYLNNIPAGGSTEVVLSPIVALAVESAQIVNPELQINGEHLSIPLTLTSGDFAELTPDGICTHFNKNGDSLVSLKLKNALQLKHGTNFLELSQAAAQKCSPRAEVTLISRGKPFGRSNKESEIDWKYLERSFEMPLVFNHSGTQESCWVISVRSGKKAKVEIELYGPVTNPTLSINNTPVKFEITLKAGERLICRDQQNWHVTNNTRKTLSEGSLKSSLPLLHAGANQMSFKSEGSCTARFNIVKVSK